MNLSRVVVGVMILGLGTSLPEILLSFLAALDGYGEVALGNVMGSNIINTGLIAGICMLFFGRTVCQQKLSQSLLKKNLICLLTSAIIFLMLQDGWLVWQEAMLLLAILTITILWLMNSQPTQHDHQTQGRKINNQAPRHMIRQWLLLFIFFFLTFIGAKLFLYGAIGLFKEFGVSDLIIGLTVVAMGTSLPEAVVSILSVRKKEVEVMFGNVIGSNLFNLLAALSFPALILDLPASKTLLNRDIPTMLAVMLVLFLMFNGRKQANSARKTILCALSLLVIFLSYQALLVNEIL